MIHIGTRDWDKGALFWSPVANERNGLAQYCRVFCTCELNLEMIILAVLEYSPGRR
jgi:hypothetical protein